MNDRFRRKRNLAINLSIDACWLWDGGAAFVVAKGKVRPLGLTDFDRQLPSRNR